MKIAIFSMLSLTTFVSASMICESRTKCPRVYFSIDYLRWRAESDQLQFAINIPGGVPGDSLFFSPANHIVNQQFKGDSGVRTRVGIFFGEGWDTNLAWTHFNNGSLTKVNGDQFGLLATPLIGLLDTSGIIATDAKSTWCLTFNTLDWEFGKWFELPCFEIRPHIGIKWAKIKQLHNIDYSGFTQQYTATVNRFNDFIATGPRFGFESAWYFCPCWSIIGICSGALLYGRFTAIEKYSLNANTLSLSTKFDECKKRIRPTVQTFIGVGWNRAVRQSFFELQVGYEAQYWWNQLQIPTSGFGILGATPVQGDLMMHGLTLRLGFTF